MRTSAIYILLFMCNCLFSISVQAQDTVYVYRSGAAIYKCAVGDLDSISYENTTLNRTSVADQLLTEATNSIFNQALVATGLIDSLNIDRDKSYKNANFLSLITNPISNGNWNYQSLPTLRKFGFTLLMESDSLFKANGINNLSDLTTYAATIYNQMYPADASISNVKDRRNSLNRFIAYHILNVKLKKSRFIDDFVMYNGSFNNSHILDISGKLMHEYYATLCPNSLLEITRKGGTTETNLINYDPQTNAAVKISKEYSGYDSSNGYIYNIDKILTFNTTTLTNLSSKRLRFDFTSFLPELINNNMRGNGATKPNQQYVIPSNYFSNMTWSSTTRVSYLTPYEKYLDYEGDEIYISGADPATNYSFSIRTFPIPEGTYEVRLGYLSNGRKGFVNFFIDSISAGAPVNMDLTASSAEIGYEFPHTVADDYEGFQNDMIMRSHGYMKAPSAFRVPVEGWAFENGEKNARFSSSALRKIVGTFTFTEMKPHQFQVAGISSGEFQLDYIEFIPTSMIDQEDIY